MPLAVTIPVAVLETILTRLAVFFLTAAGGDATAARDAAIAALAGSNPQSEGELRHAANAIVFGYQTLDALAQAATPDMPITRMLRIRANAISLHRESEKAQRRLDQLQQVRRTQKPAAIQPAPDEPARTHPEPIHSLPTQAEPAPTQPAPKTQSAAALIRDTRPAAALAPAIAQRGGVSDEENQRIAASIKRAEARLAAFAIQQPIDSLPGHATLVHQPMA